MGPRFVTILKPGGPPDCYYIQDNSMALLRLLVAALGLGGATLDFAQPTSSAAFFPPAFSKVEFQGLLQRFVNEQYLKSFRHLGEERDFDHGHLLFDSRSTQRPVAILYHTQELTTDSALNPEDRNWLQWVDRGNIENAIRYERKSYPRTAAWQWFQQRELAALRRHHTILDKMLDPELLGADVSDSRQWVFDRVDCAAPPAPASDVMQITLPSGSTVCLNLSQT
jgi:hypothetical protein